MRRNPPAVSGHKKIRYAVVGLWPADIAGLQRGDVILTFGEGEPATDRELDPRRGSDDN